MNLKALVYQHQQMFKQKVAEALAAKDSMSIEQVRGKAQYIVHHFI